MDLLSTDGLGLWASRYSSLPVIFSSATSLANSDCLAVNLSFKEGDIFKSGLVSLFIPYLLLCSAVSSSLKSGDLAILTKWPP